jgi:hypothetical protein
MDGPGHYQEAERLLALAASEVADSEGLHISYDGQAVLMLADAQVHATLAFAAATALDGGRLEEARWHDVAGTRLSDGA